MDLKPKPTQPHTTTRQTTKRGALSCLCLLMMLTGSTAHATQNNPAVAPWVTLEELNTLIPAQSLPEGAQVQALLVKQDERLNSPQCPVVLFSNPTGNRLIGRTFLKAQCIGSEIPSFFVGVDFNIWTPILVLKKTVPIGQAITQDDVEYQTLNIAQQPQGWVNDMTHLKNKTTAKPLSPGMVLKQEHLKGLPLIRRGDTVKVLVQGQGFAINGTAQAMESAEHGQSIRVKNNQGKILTGLTKEGPIVELTQ